MLSLLGFTPGLVLLVAVAFACLLSTFVGPVMALSLRVIPPREGPQRRMSNVIHG